MVTLDMRTHDKIKKKTKVKWNKVSDERKFSIREDEVRLAN